MMVLVSYDVCTEDNAGKTRLRRVAKICEKYGQRVQKSIFECLVPPEMLVQLKNALEKEMDKKKDSIRIYYLGNNWEKRVEHIGANEGYNPEGILIV
ncbi:MAG: CRISPR-associated endonuclease Cas2 [Christensenellales bacterium]|jgi:CRISPR-associated protein Cas2